VAAHYRHTTGFFVRAEYNGVGRYPFLEDNVQQQSAYQLVNAAIGYRRKHCGMSLYAKNLSDREYAHFGVPQPVGTGLTGSLGEPRTFGLEAWLSF
jgi:iron complex outermembrane receptor protein